MLPEIPSYTVRGEDISLVISETGKANIERVLRNRSKLLGRVKGYEFRGSKYYRSSRGHFVEPIYDLQEIARAVDVEPFVYQSVKAHRATILKEGYEIHGTDEEMVAYVKNRLFEISLVSGISTEQWLREFVTNLVTYHNGFLVLRRDSNRSSGRPINFHGKLLSPIAGIFVGDPTTMEVEVDKYGTVKRWRQNLNPQFDESLEVVFQPNDVIHIPIDRKTGYTFGTPYILPVLDDIRALRKLEELAIIVSSKEAFPLYHYKVGTETRPAILYEDGDTEVDQVLASVQGLPAQGFIVTSERHEVNLVSDKAGTIDFSQYLEYFEARVLAGLRLSPLELGRGGTANRGTATNINKSLTDICKDYQQVIADQLTHRLILPLLLEGGFDVNPENMVYFRFPMIDKEEERAAQNHGLQLMMGDAITCEEYRKQYLNKECMTEEQKMDTASQIEHSRNMEVTELQGRMQAQRAAATKSSSSDKVRNAVRNKAQPTNQHGTLSTKRKVTANDYETIKFEKYKDSVRNQLDNVKKKILKDIEHQNTDNYEEKFEQYLRDFISANITENKEYFDYLIQLGNIRANDDYKEVDPYYSDELQAIGDRAISRFTNNFLVKSFWKAINPYKSAILNSLAKDVDQNVNVSNTVRHLYNMTSSLERLAKDQIIMAKRFGYIKFAKRMGCKVIDLVDPKTGATNNLDISNIIYSSFLPTAETLDHYLRFPSERGK